MFEDNPKEFEQAPQTIEELERWALLNNNPVIHKAMSLYPTRHTSGVTKEKALLFAVWYLAKENAELQKMLYQKVLREPIQILAPVYAPPSNKD